MVDQSLLNYIWSYLQQGYDANSIKASLINQGYNAKDIDDAFATVYSSNYHNDVSTPN